MRHGYEQPDETELDMQQLLELIETCRRDYAENYKQFCIDNPGYVMHNDGIREKTCSDILEMLTDTTDTKEAIRLIQEKRDAAMEAYKVATGPNGHGISAGTCDIILGILS